MTPKVDDPYFAVLIQRTAWNTFTRNGHDSRTLSDIQKLPDNPVFVHLCVDDDTAWPGITYIDDSPLDSTSIGGRGATLVPTKLI